MYGQRRRLVTAAAGSFVVNAALVAALVGVDQPPADAQVPARRVPMTIAEPPPPPPPTPTAQLTEALVTSEAPQVALPQLDLPAMQSGHEGLTLPPADFGAIDWDVGLGLPSYGGKAGVAPSATAGASGPVLIERPDLRRYYPPRAARMRLTGITVLELAIDSNGRVTAVEVIESDPPGVFERAARRAARRLRYQPAARDGRAATGTTRVELEWKLDD